MATSDAAADTVIDGVLLKSSGVSEDQHAREIATLAANFLVDEGEVTKIYHEILEETLAKADVLDFLPVFVARRVSSILSTRTGSSSNLYPRK